MSGLYGHDNVNRRFVGCGFFGLNAFFIEGVNLLTGNKRRNEEVIIFRGRDII